METILRDSRFWAAVVLLVKNVLFYLLPDFPEPIWTSIDALTAVIIGVLAVNTAGQIAAARRRAG